MSQNTIGLGFKFIEKTLLLSEQSLLATFLSYGPWKAKQFIKVAFFHPLFTRKGNLFLPTVLSLECGFISPRTAQPLEGNWVE